MAAGRHVQSYGAMSVVWSAVSRVERRSAVTQYGAESHRNVLTVQSQTALLSLFQCTLCTIPNTFVNTQYTLCKCD